MPMLIESDADIKTILTNQLEAWDNKLKNVAPTWFEGEHEYRLEFHFKPITVMPLGTEPKGSKYMVEIGRISKYEDDSFEIVRDAGRKLYYRLRKEYPLLKRDLSK